MAYLALAGAIIEFVKGVPMLFGIIIRGLIILLANQYVLIFMVWLVVMVTMLIIHLR